MTRSKTAALIAIACSLGSFGGGIASGPIASPVAAGTPRDSVPRLPAQATQYGWLTSGRLPKRRSFKERKQRRAKRAQKAKR